jgi:hypothetical protein
MNFWMASLAAQVPHYSHAQQIVGAAVFVAILLVAAIASVVRHPALTRAAVSAASELDGFDDQQHCAYYQVAAQGQHAQFGACRPLNRV